MEVSYLFLHLLCIVVFAVVAPTARPTPRHPLLIVIQLLDFEVGKITLKLGDEFLGIIAYTILSLEYASGYHSDMPIHFLNGKNTSIVIHGMLEFSTFCPARLCKLQQLKLCLKSVLVTLCVYVSIYCSIKIILCSCIKQ
ncbi:uncharacterized protein LOC132642884 isoform X1 [Lycium barbarum]|uniref:uncharacterized protein LOC132642884 isoform X1 n=1 Tax=Lycium barbarum TaxID=112863 RepID=UPI00293EC6B4|nr:uncharacterized protein LOC132642884 isoform X1 [Lycium barbarum]